MSDTTMIMRLLIAAACGLIIGIERKTRLKEAGLRTHTIVAIGSALMMLVSKHGFADTGGDTARVAAQIVSGIGFLGAGMIFYKREALHGLTTAAGIWATAGIGMAIGAGMLVLGGVATAIVVFVQIMLHLPLKLLQGRNFHIINVEVDYCEGAIETLLTVFKTNRFVRFKTVRHPDGSLILSAVIRTSLPCDASTMMGYMNTYSFIRSFERLEEV